MPAIRWVVLCGFVGFASMLGHAEPPAPQASFHGIGDLPGGAAASVVRDATKVGGTIYAVGGAAGNNQVLCTGPNVPVGCVPLPDFSPDTAVLWTWNGSAGTMTVLPNLAAGQAFAQAGAISPNASYIASQARSTGPVATRVVVSSLVLGLSNPQATVASSEPGTLGLNIAPYSTTNSPRAATSVSDNGLVLYGGVDALRRAARFDVGAGTTLIPLLSGATANLPAGRGASSDGTVLVGTSFATLAAASNMTLFTQQYSGTTGLTAFRYIHGAPGTVSAIPTLSGGSWNKALAVSPNGNLTLVAGNSLSLPNGEVYLHNAATGLNTPLGSPNTPWVPTSFGGMTPDGSVVAVTFAAPGGGQHFPYFHNSHGWFHLASALAAAGVDLAPDLVSDSWSMEGGSVFGLSPDGTLIFGQALHESPTTRLMEGFVAEFAPGFLANFNPVPTAPANTALVGAWLVPGPGPDGNPGILVLRADGTYFQIEANVPASQPGGANGFERGFYTWDAVSKAFTITTVQDTNGDSGLSGINGILLTRLAISGDSLSIYLEGCSDPECTLSASRITGGPGSITGGWVIGNPAVNDSSALAVFLNDGTYYFADDGVADSSGHDGIEQGTYARNAVTGAFSSITTVDTDGLRGLSHPPPGSRTVLLSRDALLLTYIDALFVDTFTRVVGTGAVANPPPAITGTPSNLRVTAGQTAAFAAAASATPTPTAQWQVSTDNGGTFTSIGGATNPSYSFTAALADNGKQFRALFTNADGAAVTAAATLIVRRPGAPGAPSDLDGDGIGDLVVWRPGSGTWFSLSSSTGYSYAASGAKQWGNSGLGDVPLVGDIDADGKADLIVWRASTGTWFWLTSSSGYSYAAAGAKQWGNKDLGDVPMLGDVDGDGRADLIVWRASTGTWFWLTSSSGYDYARSGGRQWGSQSAGDLPRIGDIDGDGKADLIVWRASTGTWYWLTSSTAYSYAAAGGIQWGSASAGDMPLVGDVDGDGKIDLAVWRAPTGTWFWLTSSSGFSYAAAGVKQWGNQAVGDIPLLTDLDGDARADLTVWRASSGTWLWLTSSTGYDYSRAGARQWGSQINGDIPMSR